MIVLDASAAVEMFAKTAAGAAAVDAMAERLPVTVPVNFDAEVFNGLRRLHVRHLLGRDALLIAVDQLARFDAERIDVRRSLRAAVRLIDTFGGHDVFYALVAIERGCPLLTCDRGLARAATAAGLEVIAIATERS